MSGLFYDYGDVLKVCRICLCEDRRLYKMQDEILIRYQELIGVKVHPDTSGHVCWECHKRLSNLVEFRNNAIKAHNLLQKLLKNSMYHLLPIERVKHNIQTSLQLKLYEPNYTDFEYIYNEQDQKVIEEIIIPEIKLESDAEFNFTSSDEVIETDSVKKKKKTANKKKSPPKTDKRRKPANEVLNSDIFSITDLSYEDQVLEIKNRQDSANYKKSEFKCLECFKGFLDEDAYKGHVSRHTEQCGVYQCDICKIRFKKQHALKNHTTSHMQKFSCKKCPYVTTRRHAAKLHEEFHNGTRYQCPHCAEDFVKISTYMSHVRIKHPSDFVCDLCGYSFISGKGLGLHKKLKHRFEDQQVPTDGPICIQCDVQFVSTEALARHMKLSAKHNDKTDTARKRVRRPTELESKRISAEEKKKRNNWKPEGPISCEQCEMQLPDSLSYYRHFRRTHPDKNRTNYPSMKSKSMCEVCGKMFQSLALLQDHSWTHTDSKQFKCTQCDKCFQRKYRLIAHARVHRACPARHACVACGKRFTTASNMQRHMFSHTGLKPFKCEMCGKCFKHASEKRVHVTYVHLKKPWPKRTRGKRRSDSRQLQVSSQITQNGSEPDIVQPLWGGLQ